MQELARESALRQDFLQKMLEKPEKGEPSPVKYQEPNEFIKEVRGRETDFRNISTTVV